MRKRDVLMLEGMSRIANAVNKQTNSNYYIEEKKLAQDKELFEKELEVKDRVNISLKEYERLKKYEKDYDRQLHLLMNLASAFQKEGIKDDKIIDKLISGDFQVKTMCDSMMGMHRVAICIEFKDYK